MHQTKKGIKKKGTVISVLLVVLLLFQSFCADAIIISHSANGTVIADILNVRKRDTTTSDVVVTVSEGTAVTIKKTVTNSLGEKWYKIKVKVNNTSYTGYVMASFVRKKTSSTSKASTTTTQSATSSKPAKTGRYRYGNLKTNAILYRSRSKQSAIVAYLKPKTLVYAGQKKKVGRLTWYRVSTKGLSKNYSGYIQSKQIKFQTVTVKSTRYKVAFFKKKTQIYKTANSTDTIKGTASKRSDAIILGTLKVGGKKWAKVKTKLGTGYATYSNLTPVTSTVKSTIKYEATTKKSTACRKVSCTLATNRGTIPSGATINVLGQLTVNNTLWYKASYLKGSSTITGYVLAKNVNLSTEAAFQTALQVFPESYRPALIQLHAAHPTWMFHPVNTGLDWNEVIANECCNGKNTIQSNCPKGGAADAYSVPFSYLSTAAGDYDWATDTYTLRDGSNWYEANEQVVSYYIDPRNFLNEKGIFQFEALNYEATQTKDVVATMLNNTFMSGNYNVTDIATGKTAAGSYADAFMDAAATSNVSPYYLVTRVKNEVGTNGSDSTSGTLKGYEGYYNFYNIGANDSATGQAIANGLSWAKSGTTYNRPWTTPYKSIVGGASYIASLYIGIGQNTMYTQKFNVVVPTSLYVHQYMTSVTASNSYATNNYNTYSTNKILDHAYTFYIPFYNNMPAATCSLPASTGNPNCYVKSLTLKNSNNNKTINLNATFNYLTSNYTAVVANSVNKIKISAKPVSTYASVSGTGTYSLATGNNTIKVTCTAGNGSKATYTITITRQP